MRLSAGALVGAVYQAARGDALGPHKGYGRFSPLRWVRVGIWGVRGLSFVQRLKKRTKVTGAVRHRGRSRTKHVTHCSTR